MTSLSAMLEKSQGHILIILWWVCAVLLNISIQGDVIIKKKKKRQPDFSKVLVVTDLYVTMGFDYSETATTNVPNIKYLIFCFTFTYKKQNTHSTLSAHSTILPEEGEIIFCNTSSKKWWSFFGIRMVDWMGTSLPVPPECTPLEWVGRGDISSGRRTRQL